MKNKEEHEAFTNLLVAEAEWLKASGWKPCAPSKPGGEVLWHRVNSGISTTTVKQDLAVTLTKSERKLKK